MIRWKDIDPPMSVREQGRWRRSMCHAATQANGLCMGYARSDHDDEPCEVCKACDKLGIEVGE